MRQFSRLNLALNRPSIAGESSAPFSPDGAQMPPLTIWWDFSNPSGQTINPGNGLGAQGNVGNGGTATLVGPAGASTAGYDPPQILPPFLGAPVKFATFENNFEVARLGGTNTVYRRSSNSFTVATIFLTFPNTFYTFGMQGRTSGTVPGWLLGGAGSEFGLYMRDAALTNVNCTFTDSDVHDSNLHTLIGVRDNANSVVKVYLDGVEVASTAIPGGFGVIDQTYVSPWNDFMIGARPAGGSAIYQASNTMFMGEFLIYNSPLTQEQVTLLHNYHITKWSV